MAPPPPPETPPDGPDAPAAPSGRPSPFLLGIAGALFLGGLVLTLIALAHRPDYVVLAGMDDAELRWFRPQVERFAEDHHVKLAVTAWPDPEALARLLSVDRRREHPRVLLAEVPTDRLAALADSSALLPLAPVLGDRMDALGQRFHPLALADGRVAGRQFALPSRLTTLCLYYSKAHVADAYAHWTNVRPQVESWLKEVNGFGLPEDFRFEDNVIGRLHARLDMRHQGLDVSRRGMTDVHNEIGVDRGDHGSANTHTFETQFFNKTPGCHTWRIFEDGASIRL